MARWHIKNQIGKRIKFSSPTAFQLAVQEAEELVQISAASKGRTFFAGEDQSIPDGKRP